MESPNARIRYREDVQVVALVLGLRPVLHHCYKAVRPCSRSAVHHWRDRYHADKVPASSPISPSSTRWFNNDSQCPPGPLVDLSPPHCHVVRPVIAASVTGNCSRWGSAAAHGLISHKLPKAAQWCPSAGTRVSEQSQEEVPDKQALVASPHLQAQVVHKLHNNTVQTSRSARAHPRGPPPIGNQAERRNGPRHPILPRDPVTPGWAAPFAQIRFSRCPL
ncbi:hypothetical protein NDU88_003891 [Pleurodeles waltl]|uniref:Uncharacterized protein n=1 Tax=Pleurodeles waltl TaxID=8319 RepID=A0AAV7KW77_PLEWA|nr:hypothetical protein NDU88_003891 [Pleurodeles waltl]